VLWISNLSDTVRTDDIINLFEKYGPVHEVQIKGPFCKVEFENRGDAKKARYGLDTVDFHGRRLSVDWFRGENTEPLLQGTNWWGGYPGKPRFRHRVYILNLPCDTEHSKLLNLAWEAGNSVVFLDVMPCPFDEQSNVGIIEYAHEVDYKYALNYLDGMNYDRQKLRWISEEQYRGVEKQLGQRNRPVRHTMRGMIPMRNNSGTMNSAMRPSGNVFMPQNGMAPLVGPVGYNNGTVPPGPNPMISNINTYSRVNDVQPMSIDGRNESTYPSTSSRYENSRSNDSAPRYRYNVPLNTQNLGNGGQRGGQGNVRLPWQ